MKTLVLFLIIISNNCYSQSIDEMETITGKEKLKGMAQAGRTFMYEITLFEQFKNSSNWSKKEKNIQQEHLTYLDSLTKKGLLEMGGIANQGLEKQTGLIILTVNNYEQAEEIVQNDPSIKKGMMSAKLSPINIYFRKE